MDALRGRRFAEDDETKHNVREEHRRFNKDIYVTVMQRLRQTSKKGVDNEETLWKNNFKFQCNCNYSFGEKKIGSITFSPALVRSSARLVRR
jgi:hypothetical protein